MLEDFQMIHPFKKKFIVLCIIASTMHSMDRNANPNENQQTLNQNRHQTYLQRTILWQINYNYPHIVNQQATIAGSIKRSRSDSTSVTTDEPLRKRTRTL